MRKIGFTAWVIGLLFIACGLARGNSPADPQAVLHKAIQALGGEAKLGKLQGVTAKGHGTINYFGNDLTFKAEWFFQVPDRYRINAEGDAFSWGLIVNGDKGWVKLNEFTEEMTPERLAEEKERIYLQEVTALVSLENKDYKLSPLGEAKVNDRPAQGLTVSRKGHGDVKLFFDKDNHQLLKAEMVVKRQGVETVQENYYGDYKEHDGIQRPSKLTTKLDGKDFMELDITEFKPQQHLDDKIFEKP